MKYLMMILTVMCLIGCKENEIIMAPGIEGEYYQGMGSINNKEVWFVFVTELPADLSINVMFTTITTRHQCRYYLHEVVGDIRTYVSEPDDLAVVQIKTGPRPELLFYSEEGEETDPCKKLKSTISYVYNI